MHNTPIVGILKNEDPQSGKKWAIACSDAGLEYETIELSNFDWIKSVCDKKFDFFLTEPPNETERFRILYDERIYIISKILNKRVFPSYDEILIYENKKMLSYFLTVAKIPHPRTWVSYVKSESQDFVETLKLPIVAKTSIGASGNGVEIIRSKAAFYGYIRKAFSNGGIKRRFGPNRVSGSPKKWISKTLVNPKYFFSKLNEYIRIHRDGQKGYIILQEYIDHDFEWRVVKIGESFFAHKKIKYRDKASGSKGIDYVNPPFKLLNFVRDLCLQHHFNFMAVDIFETKDGDYLVNELQTLFGHVQDHLLEVDGLNGRYLFEGGKWVFEHGDFNANESFNLRLKTAIRIFENGE